MTDWNKLKVPELKAELKTRGLPQTGLKAALVARLEVAENESGFESEATIQGDATEPSNNSPTPTIPDVETESTTEPHDVAAPQRSANKTTEVLEDVAPSGSEVESSYGQESTSIGTIDAASKPNLPAVEKEEVVEDIQKRKRRSQSPPPTPADAPRKRARQDKDLPLNDLDIDETVGGVTTSRGDVEWVEKNNGVDEAMVNAEAKEAPSPGDSVEPGPTVVDSARADILVEPASEINTETSTSDKLLKDDDAEIEANDEETEGKAKDSRFKELFSGPPSKAEKDSTLDRPSFQSDTPHPVDKEPDRYVAPSIHPATAALYIRDFMRPLNAAALREHLTILATPPGATLDPNIVVEFFLDPIRTHAFIRFENISAASRVRSELHDRIWPDERTRKPLWVDFIPTEKVQAWITEEQLSGASRSAAKKWEVVYNFDGGDVTVSLEEAGMASASARKPSLATAPPTAPVQPVVAGAPSGPRSQQAGSARAAMNLSALDQLFKSTVAKPVLYYQPVSKELADKRLDNIDYATSKRYSSSRDGGSEINRYTFEDKEVLVDRGPEIFPGIRPPPGYRGRGGGGGYRSGRGGRGGRGGDRYLGSRRDDQDPRDRDRRY